MVAEMVPMPEAEHQQHHQTGHRGLDIVLGVSAVVISMISMFLAIQHGRVMEKMVQASTWPYVEAGYSTGNSDGSPHVTVWVINKGVGPARVDSVEVFYEGVAQSDPQELLRSILKPSDPSRHFRVIQSDVIQGVLSSRELVNVVDLDPRDYDPADYSRVQKAIQKLQMRVCYCSVLEECSVIDTRRTPVRAVSVNSCPVVRQPFQH
jgi:hypothetical protein